MKNTTTHLAVNAFVATIYVVLTVPLGAISTNSFIQIRPAEALTILPALMPYTVVGLTVGCAIANFVSQFGIWDVLLGSLVTFIAAILTSKTSKRFYLAPLPPVLLNAILLPLVWLLVALIDNPASTIAASVYFAQVLSLLISQSIVCFGLGIPLYFVTKKRILPLLENAD